MRAFNCAVLLSLVRVSSRDNLLQLFFVLGEMSSLSLAIVNSTSPPPDSSKNILVGRYNALTNVMQALYPYLRYSRIFDLGRTLGNSFGNQV